MWQVGKQGMPRPCMYGTNCQRTIKILFSRPRGSNSFKHLRIELLRFHTWNLRSFAAERWTRVAVCKPRWRVSLPKKCIHKNANWSKFIYSGMKLNHMDSCWSHCKIKCVLRCHDKCLAVLKETNRLQILTDCMIKPVIATGDTLDSTALRH